MCVWLRCTVPALQSMCKMLHVLVRVFAHIVKEGFCRPADEHEGEGEGQSKSLEDDVEGTGMGAGEGVSQRCTAVLFSES